MTQTEFDKFLISFAAEAENLLQSKGKDYSREHDRLSNFKEIAAATNMKPMQVWLIYAMKHMTALAKFASGEPLNSESARSRFLDLSNYCVLGAALASTDYETCL